MFNAGAFVLLLGTVVATLVGFSDPLICSVVAAVAAAVLMLGWASHRRSRRRPGSFAAHQIDLVRQYRREVSFGDWDVFIGADVPREVAGARRAEELARKVLSLPGWSSEYLAGQRLRLDPAHEAAQIRLAARELYDLRCEFEATSTGGGSTGELVGCRMEWDAHLHASWAALDDRLAVFHDWVQDVIEVAVLAEKADLATHLMVAWEEHGPRLTVRTVRHEMAASDLNALRTELQAVKLGLSDNRLLNLDTSSS